VVYAENTKVTPARSRNEIEETLRRYGATSFAYGWSETVASVQFDAHGRRIRIHLPMPDEASVAFTPQGRKRSNAQIKTAFAQAERSRWRALLLIIKAKLEAVDAGVTTFEEEFLSHIVLPSGETVGQHVIPRVDQAYNDGQMPEMLPGVGVPQLGSGY
jgi:hypothetical protein